ncbi:Aste57867_22217 [Aphanomyces stellatus]|uniref:Aste57867_22217 protein n=1 Tax=Aphanomyces stellatus TaxID=120398 RepID=A0A485LPI8_9STRA|nr:hypothetical protein As57867_022148 [Aphanomyces stellatus]VFT98884.1 Aste57867_22217 [Aphanomyces stellatus]
MKREYVTTIGLMCPQDIADDDQERQIKRRRYKDDALSLTELPQEAVLSVLQYLDGKCIIQLSSTCQYLKTTLDVMWGTLFLRYMNIAPNLYAASWKQYLKRMFCAGEKRCFVCLEKNSPAIRPWQFVNLCNDHRKHCTKSVLISKTYAKEQFSLKEADLAPLQFIVRGKQFYLTHEF